VHRESEAADWPEISVRLVTPDYFGTLRVPLIRGRFLEDRDRTSSPAGVVVNQAVMDRMFPKDDPVGHDIRLWGSTWHIVGVVGSERFHGVAKDAPIAVYLPLGVVSSSSEALIVRTTADPAALAPVVRATIRAIDPALVVYGLEPLDVTLANSLSGQRFLMSLLTAFAALALVLAAIGIHGVLSCSVTQRYREIGLRMALGADAHRVLRSVMAEGAALTGIGLALGVGLSLLLGRVMNGLLFGVRPTDVTTFVASVIVLGVVASISIWLPARRAVSVDPLVALRQE
jgi:predicted permease